MLTGIKIKSASWDCPWTIEDDSRLLAGVYEYGLGSWEAIKMDPSYKLADKVVIGLKRLFSHTFHDDFFLFSRCYLMEN